MFNRNSSIEMVCHHPISIASFRDVAMTILNSHKNIWLRRSSSWLEMKIVSGEGEMVPILFQTRRHQRVRPSGLVREWEIPGLLWPGLHGLSVQKSISSVAEHSLWFRCKSSVKWKDFALKNRDLSVPPGFLKFYHHHQGRKSSFLFCQALIYKLNN